MGWGVRAHPKKLQMEQEGVRPGLVGRSESSFGEQRALRPSSHLQLWLCLPLDLKNKLK
jgi:hypothetical protein